jgi:1-acyl-sn-glycerol-3-phosphate acyltransferase
MLRSWARAACLILGMKVTVRGVPPRPPFLLVANHLGYVDVLLLASRVRGVFVARGDLARWPVLGVLTRSVGTLYLDRSHKRDLPRVAGQVKEALAQGLGVFFFPEATSSDGAEVLPFKPSLLEIASDLAMPVSFASLSYTTPPQAPPARLSVCWWGEMTFFSHVWKLLSLPGFAGKISFGEEALLASDRKVLAARLREAIRSGLEPITS